MEQNNQAKAVSTTSRGRALQRCRLSPPRSNASMIPDPNGDWVRYQDLPPMLPANAEAVFEKHTRGLLSKRQHAQVLEIFRRATGLPDATRAMG